MARLAGLRLRDAGATGTARRSRAPAGSTSRSGSWIRRFAEPQRAGVRGVLQHGQAARTAEPRATLDRTAAAGARPRLADRPRRASPLPFALGAALALELQQVREHRARGERVHLGRIARRRSRPPRPAIERGALAEPLEHLPLALFAVREVLVELGAARPARPGRGPGRSSAAPAPASGASERRYCARSPSGGSMKLVPRPTTASPVNSAPLRRNEERDVVGRCARACASARRPRRRRRREPLPVAAGAPRRRAGTRTAARRPSRRTPRAPARDPRGRASPARAATRPAARATSSQMAAIVGPGSITIAGSCADDPRVRPLQRVDARVRRQHAHDPQHRVSPARTSSAAGARRSSSVGLARLEPQREQVCDRRARGEIASA